ncbi:MAG: energy transducer TonB [Candidatus Sulfotelmatobacter sp.]
MGRRFPVAVLFVAILASAVAIPSSAQEAAPGVRKIVSRVTPQYPTMARSMNIRGSVKAEAVVAPNGTVKSVEIKGGHPLLAQAAENAIREWKFVPAPKETRETIEVKFNPE